MTGQNSHSYRPKIDPAYWEAIRDFVRDIAKTVELRIPYQLDAIYNGLTDFALWAWQTAGLPLDAATLFERSVIVYYTQVGCGQLTMAARGNRRSLLLRIEEVLRETGPTRLPPMPPSNPSEPYDAKQLVSVVSWARGQSTPSRRSNAHMLVTLGLGAGLSAQEIIALRVRDIHRDGPDIDVTIPEGRTRTVAMLREFADIMPNVQHEDGDAYAFRRGRTVAYVNAISNFVRRGNNAGLRPQTQRMRATWIVRHLNAGTPLSVLVAAAGLESLDALARFERFATPVPPDRAERALRYADVPATTR
jgi:integrase